MKSVIYVDDTVLDVMMSMLNSDTPVYVEFKKLETGIHIINLRYISHSIYMSIDNTYWELGLYLRIHDKYLVRYKRNEGLTYEDIEQNMSVKTEAKQGPDIYICSTTKYGPKIERCINIEEYIKTILRKVEAKLEKILQESQ